MVLSNREMYIIIKFQRDTRRPNEAFSFLSCKRKGAQSLIPNAESDFSF